MPVFNRRDFLRGLGASALFLSAPEKLLMGSILDGTFNKTHASTSGVDEKILINLFFHGGPSRWYYDLPLRPNGNDDIIDNGMTKNRFVIENGAVKAVLETHKVGNFHLPYLWKANIPTINGGVAPMANLAQSALFIRGYDLINDGHYQNTIKHNSPVPGAPSLSGIFSDHSNKPFSAITDNDSFQHKSAIGKSLVTVPLNGDPFTSMMAPFNLPTPKSFNRRQVMDDAIKTLHKNVSSYFGKQNPYATTLKAERDSSIELFLKGSSGLKEKYTALYNKYRTLERRAYTETLLEGIDDLEIIVQKNSLYKIQANEIIEPSAVGGDLRTLITANTASSIMAESFAIAEYIVTENLSSSLMLAMSNLQNINLSNFNYVVAGTNTSRTGFNIFNFDAHATGSHVALYAFSKFYLAFAACLYEFIGKLQEKNLFDQTLILLSSEFNRSAHNAGTGADHGFQGSATSIYSGIFKKGDGPIVIGNVNNFKGGGGYAGTWGYAAPVSAMNNRTLNIGNIMSTITGLAGYETPTKNDAPLLKIINGNLMNIAGLPKNIT